MSHGLDHVSMQPDEAAPCPEEGDAGSGLVDCCWTEANPVDAIAPASLVFSAPTSTLRNDAVAVVTPAERRSPVAVESDASPPIAFQLLFSVFLI